MILGLNGTNKERIKALRLFYNQALPKAVTGVDSHPSTTPRCAGVSSSAVSAGEPQDLCARWTR